MLKQGIEGVFKVHVDQRGIVRIEVRQAFINNALVRALRIQDAEVIDPETRQAWRGKSAGDQCKTLENANFDVTTARLLGRMRQALQQTNCLQA